MVIRRGLAMPDHTKAGKEGTMNMFIRRGCLACATLVVLAGLVISQPLSGPYTVGPGGSFANIAAAGAALAGNGVSGPVLFTVLANDVGPWTIPAFTGQGPANPVVFDGLGTCTISGAQPILTLSGCSDVTFNGFNATLAATAAGVTINAGTTNCVFRNCNITGPSVTTPTAAVAFNFSGGSGCRIEDSTFGGLYEAFNSAAANDQTIIQRCRITGGGYWVCQINGTNLTLRNNFISGASNFGIRAGATCTNLKIHHNSVRITHTASSSQYCSLRWYGASTLNTEVLNNIFVDVFPAAAANVYNMWCSGVLRPTVMNYNCFQNINGTYPVYASADQTLASWQALGFDLNSVSADPLYTAPASTPPDLRINSGSPCASAGTTIATVPADIFGSPRTPPVDIGAFELTSGNLLTALTTGGGAGDLNLSLTAINPLATEGFTLISMNTTGAAGTGPILGIMPDALTWSIFGFPQVAGSPFHFPIGVLGVFPDASFVLPPGALSSFSGLSWDMVVLLLGPGWSYVGQSNVVRINW